MKELGHKEYLKVLKEYFKEVTSTKENAEKFLFEVGIHDKNGNLSENYK
jgi:hypothetical protein